MRRVWQPSLSFHHGYPTSLSRPAAWSTGRTERWLSRYPSIHLASLLCKQIFALKVSGANLRWEDSLVQMRLYPKIPYMSLRRTSEFWRFWVAKICIADFQVSSAHLSSWEFSMMVFSSAPTSAKMFNMKTDKCLGVIDTLEAFLAYFNSCYNAVVVIFFII